MVSFAAQPKNVIKQRSRIAAMYNTAFPPLAPVMERAAVHYKASRAAAGELMHSWLNANE